MTQSYGLLAISLASAILFSLLVRLARFTAGRAENLILRGLLVLGLALTAASLLIRLSPEPPPVTPLLHVIVDEGLLGTSMGEVRRALGRVPPAVETRVATYASPPGSRGAGPGPGAEPRAFPAEARFSSPAAALGWAGIEAEARGGGAVLLLSGRALPAWEPEGLQAASVVIPPGLATEETFAFSAPGTVFQGRPAAVRADVKGRKEKRLRLRILEGGRLREERTVTIGDEGRERVDFSLDNLGAGTHILRLDVVDGSGAFVGRRYAELFVREAPGIDFVREGGLDSPLSDYLRARGFPVEVHSADSFSSGRLEPEGEILLLQDLPPSRLTWTDVSHLYRGISRGDRGVLVVGGTRSFGPGGYGGSPLERLLPLWMGLKDGDRETHSTAFLVLVDTSASMLCQPEGCPSDRERMWGPRREARGPRVRKIELALQALVNLLPAMKEMDTFGILGGRASPYWEIEPGSMETLEELEGRIRSIDVGGSGIHLYSSLLEARKVMTGIDAEIKHVVVLIDTDDVDEINVLGLGSVENLVSEMNGEDVSVSFVGIGFSDDRYVPLLSRLASSTGGYLYLTSDITEVPSFLLDDREKLSRDQVVRKHLQTRPSGIDLPWVERTPPLEGQFITEAKRDAVTLVWSELGYPLFVMKQIGRGTVAAMAADGGEDLAPAWIGSDAGRVWDRLLAKLIDAPPDSGKLFVALKGQSLSTYYMPGREGAFLPMEAGIEGPGGGLGPSPMTEVFPGIYRTDFGEVPPGSYRLSCGSRSGGTEKFEAVFELSGEEATYSTGEIDYGALQGEESPQGPAPLGGRWFRILLIAAAACTVLYELIRGR